MSIRVDANSFIMNRKFQLHNESKKRPRIQTLDLRLLNYTKESRGVFLIHVLSKPLHTNSFYKQNNA